jgi:DNA polymerase-1
MSKVVEETKPVYNTYEDFNYDDLNLYAGLDCIATSKLLSKLYPKLAEEPSFIVDMKGNKPVYTKLKSLIEVNEEVTLPALDYILDLEQNGMKYDKVENRNIHGRMTEEVGILKDSIFSMIGHEIDLNSGTKVAEFLYVEKGFTPPGLTATGEPSTDGEALLKLAGLDPLNPGRYITPDPSLQYLAWMAKQKDISSVHGLLIKDYIEDFVKSDGRVHASYNLHGTSSFRITGGEPNFTQISRPRHGYNIKDCYIVDEGEVFLALDFSSAEMKILACLSGDEAMKDACVKGFDFHTFTASTMLGVPYDEFLAVLKDKTAPKNAEYKQLRQGAKAVGFGIVYGSSAKGIAFGLGISDEEAEKLIALYFDRFPRVKTYIANKHRDAILNRRIVTPFGQRRQSYGSYDVFKKTAAYNASLRGMQNCSIQSPTSTLGLLAFAEMNEKGIKPLGGKALATIYDSCEWSIPLDKAAEALEAGFYYMNDWPQEYFPWLDIPIGVEAELGTRWGNAEVVHRGTTQAEIEALIQRLKQQQ